MKAKHLLVFATILGSVSMHSLQKRDWVPPLDWGLCTTLNKKCSAQLSNIDNLLKNEGFTSLVTNGRTNIDCSETRKGVVSQCFRRASEVCISSLATDLILRNKVYNYICSRSQAFIAAEPCLTSGIFTRVRNQCRVGTGKRPYLSEANCSNAPNCVRSMVGRSGRCTRNDANLFKGLVQQEYTLNMYNCRMFVQ